MGWVDGGYRGDGVGWGVTTASALPPAWQGGGGDGGGGFGGVCVCVCQGVTQL